MFVTSSATRAQALDEAFQRLAEIIFGQMDMDQAQGRGVRAGGAHGDVETALRADLVTGTAAQDGRQLGLVPRVNVIPISSDL
jgi:hypothetical protein